jgi:hypothetical protein
MAGLRHHGQHAACTAVQLFLSVNVGLGGFQGRIIVG